MKVGMQEIGAKAQFPDTPTSPKPQPPKPQIDYSN